MACLNVEKRNRRGIFDYTNELIQGFQTKNNIVFYLNEIKNFQNASNVVVINEKIFEFNVDTDE